MGLVRAAAAAGQEVRHEEVELRNGQQDFPRLRVPLPLAGNLRSHSPLGPDRREVRSNIRTLVPEDLLLLKSLGNTPGTFFLDSSSSLLLSWV